MPRRYFDLWHSNLEKGRETLRISNRDNLLGMMTPFILWWMTWKCAKGFDVSMSRPLYIFPNSINTFTWFKLPGDA